MTRRYDGKKMFGRWKLVICMWWLLSFAWSYSNRSSTIPVYITMVFDIRSFCASVLRISLSCRRVETHSSASLLRSRGPWRPRRRPTRCPSGRGGPTCSPTSAARCSAHNRVPLHGAEVEELKSTLPVNFATAASEPASRPAPAVPCLVTAAATRVRRVQAILATSTAWTARTARAAPGCHAVR